jgi:exopolyphosphatase/guanosine-5'-triphosphate,3'-diphosphate pyrophosphatase
MEIISGDQEADWVFQGATTDSSLADSPILLLDVGGGSSEFILGKGNQKDFGQSLPLGSVRLMERFPAQDPPGKEPLAACRGWVREFLEKELKPGLQPLLSSRQQLQLVGTGGTASILARMETCLEDYDRGRIEATRISRDRLRWHVEHLWSVPLEERKQIVGLPRSRADVILFGAVIYEAVMEMFGFSTLRISTRGLRFAVVLEG